MKPHPAHLLPILMTMQAAFSTGSTYPDYPKPSYDICGVCQCREKRLDCQGVCCSGSTNIDWIFSGSRVFANITSLRIGTMIGFRLDVENVSLSNHFPRLRRMVFTRFISLEYGISHSFFKGMSELKQVWFFENYLWDIPIKALDPIADSLIDLGINYQSHIRKIPPGGFANFSNMISLQLKLTRINSLDNSSFLGLNNLRVLNLEYNNIRFIAEGAFVHTIKLIYLNISNNLILSIPLSFNCLRDLEVLDMNSNNISNIRNLEFLSKMSNISTLNLRNNNISLVSNSATGFLRNSSAGISGLCSNPYICKEELCRFMQYVIAMPNTSKNDIRVQGSQICNYDCFSIVEYSSYKYSFNDALNKFCSQLLISSTMEPPKIKHDGKSLHVTGIVVGLIAGFGLIIFGIVVFRKLRRLRHQRGGYIYAGLQYLLPIYGNDPEIKFDALVYHHNDEIRFVDEQLRPRLEENPNNFRLCLPLIRDFRLGAKRLNNLRESLISSRCAIFVISHAFIQDARCKQALEVACDYLHRDDLGPPHLKQTGLILVLLDPVHLDMLPEVLRVLVDRLVTLEWDNLAEERCWLRLEQTLRNLRDIEHEDNA